MIRIVLGLPGSGKSAMIVREMKINSDKYGRYYYSNIMTKKIKNNNEINKDMIFKKNILKTKKDGTIVSEYQLNEEFWKNLREENKKKDISLNVVIDEAHTLMNPRRSMSKINIIMGDFMSLLRRMLGSSEAGYGELILITQLKRRLDVIALEMATKIQWCVCHYMKVCNRCKSKFPETNEIPDKLEQCPKCRGRRLKRQNFFIEVFCFQSDKELEIWQTFRMKTYYDHYYIKDIENYFSYYDTLQWDSLVSELYA